MRVELHPDARTELHFAALWYEERRSGRGDEFIGEVSATLARIGDAPLSSAQWPGTGTAPTTIRRSFVSRFPYVLVEVHMERVFVLAVAQTKRRPLADRRWLVVRLQTYLRPRHPRNDRFDSTRRRKNAV